MEKDYEKIAQEIITTEDLYQLLDDISELETRYYEINKAGLNKEVESDLETGFLKEIEEYMPRSKEKRLEYLTGLKEYLLKLPKASLGLAFRPGRELLNEISEFINAGADHKIVLDIFVKPSLVAGLTIDYQGKYKDYSYATKLQEALKERFAHEKF